MRKTVEDYLVAFILENGGGIQERVVGQSLQGQLLIAGKERPFAFGHGGNPIRARVCVDLMPENPEHVMAFGELLEDVDPAADFSHRVICGASAVYWVFDLLLPNCSLKELLGLWYTLSHIEVERIDGLLRTAQGGRTEEGKYQFPALSFARN